MEIKDLEVFIFELEVSFDDWVFKKVLKKDKKKVEKIVCFVMIESEEFNFVVIELV